MQSEFSAQPLEALLAAGHDVRFVLRPLSRAQRRAPVMLDPDEVENATHPDPAREPFLIAQRAGIPRFLVGDASSEPVRELVAKERVDGLAICFFNQLLKPSLLDLLPLGAVNAHPSLLPAYRGPSPLFWAFRDGREQTGVTVHRVSPGEDDGRVFSRTAIELPFGVRGEEIVPALAAAATQGIVDAVSRMDADERDLKAQDHARATRAPRPDAEAKRVDPSLGARRLYHWVRGVGRWNRLRFDASGVPLRATDALEVSDTATLPADYALVGDRLTLRCPDGAVVLRVSAAAARAA